jgi:large subunit ribosomal protein L12
MEYVYAALLLHKLGQDVNVENVGKVVAATGVDVDDTKVKSLIASLKDVDIEKELENASLVTASAASSNDSAKEEKKEEKPKEEKKEAAAAGLGALFG